MTGCAVPTLLAELVELGREAWRISERERAVRAEIEALRETEDAELCTASLRTGPRRAPMSEPSIAVAQEADRYTADRMAAVAATKAKRLWPNVIGEVLASEIMALLDLPSWLRPQTRTQLLINTILSIPEGAAEPCCSDPCHSDPCHSDPCHSERSHAA